MGNVLFLTNFLLWKEILKRADERKAKAKEDMAVEEARKVEVRKMKTLLQLPVIDALGRAYSTGKQWLS